MILHTNEYCDIGDRSFVGHYITMLFGHLKSFMNSTKSGNTEKCDKYNTKAKSSKAFLFFLSFSWASGVSSLTDVNAIQEPNFIGIIYTLFE